VELTSSDTALERRRDIINYLNSKYPGYLDNIDAEKSSMADLTAATRKLNEQMVNRVIVQRHQEKIDEQNEKVADRAVDVAEARIDLTKEIAKREREFNIVAKEGTTIQERATAVIEAQNQAYKDKFGTNQGQKRGGIAAKKLAEDLAFAERKLTKEQDKGNDIFKERDAILKQLNISLGDSEKLINKTSESTNDSTAATVASTAAKQNDVNELGRSADAMAEMKAALDALFMSVAMEGSMSEKMELANVVSSLKQAADNTERMKNEMAGLLIEPPFDPMLPGQDAFNEGLEDTVELMSGQVFPVFNAFAKNMDTINWAIGEFGNILTASFEAALTSGEKFFPTLMKALGDMIKKLIAAAIAAAVLAAAITVAFGGNFANIGKLFGGAKNFGQLFGKMFGEMSGIPGLAEGGIVTGPTLAMVGEGRGPEAVIPLDRLHEFTGGGGGVQVYGRIQGADILLSSERATRVRSRYRGF
jgi:hypothetical protein